MNKHILMGLIATAVSSPVLSESNNTIYGSLRLAAYGGDDKALDVTNDYSRIGLKGSSDTDFEGIKALYQFEAGVNGQDPSQNASQNEGQLVSRLTWVGLEGGFGTLKVGQQWSILYNLVTGAAEMTISTSAETQPSFRVDSAVTYYSPVFSGLHVAASTYADTDDTSSDQADHYSAAARYTADAITLAAGFDRAADPHAEDVSAFSLTYHQDAITIIAVLEHMKTDQPDAESRRPYELAGSYTVENSTLIATAYKQDRNNESGINLEYQNTIGEKSMVYASVQSDQAGNKENRMTYGLGLRVDF